MEKPEIKVDKRRYLTKEQYQKEYHKENQIINDTGLVCEAIRRKTSKEKMDLTVTWRKKSVKRKYPKGFGKCSSKYRVEICPDCECKLCPSCKRNPEIHGCINGSE